MKSENRFEERYVMGEIPWDLGRADTNLVKMVEQLPVKGCRALDIGCGTGDNALWLTGKGFQVTGVDISSRAIEEARTKALQSDVEPRFLEADFLQKQLDEPPYGFVFDRGCFHSLDSPEQHVAFARNVWAHLDQNGLWLSLVASADAPQRDPGPPRLSAVEIATAVEPLFEILSLVSGHLDSNRPDPIRCWVCMMKKRFPN